MKVRVILNQHSCPCVEYFDVKTIEQLNNEIVLHFFESSTYYKSRGKTFCILNKENIRHLKVLYEV